MYSLILLALTLLVSAAGWYYRKRTQSAPGPRISLVYLLRAPRPLSESVLQDVIGRELGIVFPPGNDATTFIAQMPVPPDSPVSAARGAMFMLRIEDRIFGINNVGTPYVKNPEAEAATIPEGRLRKAFAEHTAWLSVDLVSGCASEAERADAYRVIGRVMAGLAWRDCLAILCPEINLCNVFDPSLLEKLRSADPLSLFEHGTFDAILEVHSEDPRMKAAVAEAKARWPEFVAAYQEAGAPRGDAPFIAKARFEEGGKVEFMWFTVTAIDGETVHGQLENMPHELKGLRKDDPVTVARAEVVDWLYAKDNLPVGGFTQQVIAEAHRQR